jgi:hypothetical protein
LIGRLKEWNVALHLLVLTLSSKPGHSDQATLQLALKMLSSQEAERNQVLAYQWFLFQVDWLQSELSDQLSN